MTIGDILKFCKDIGLKEQKYISGCVSMYLNTGSENPIFLKYKPYFSQLEISIDVIVVSNCLCPNNVIWCNSKNAKDITKNDLMNYYIKFTASVKEAQEKIKKLKIKSKLIELDKDFENA